MLGLAEYAAASADLLGLGQKYEAAIASELTENITKRQAIQIARAHAADYGVEYRLLLNTAMHEAAQNALKYYQGKVNIVLEEEQKIIDALVNKQYTEKYYGATLRARLITNERVLLRRITQSAQVGPSKVSNAWTKPVPFGSQTAVDKRILLSTLSKIENDAARMVASHADIQLIRWTVSHRHSTPDICDDLAATIESATVRYMQEHDLHEDPKGLYLRDRLPLPPHPNCQCEYMLMVDGKTHARGRVRRTIEKVRSLLRRLRKK